MDWEITGMRNGGGSCDRTYCVSLLFLWQPTRDYLKEEFIEASKGFYALSLPGERLSRAVVEIVAVAKGL